MSDERGDEPGARGSGAPDPAASTEEEPAPPAMVVVGVAPLEQSTGRRVGLGPAGDAHEHGLEIAFGLHFGARRAQLKEHSEAASSRRVAGQELDEIRAFRRRAPPRAKVPAGKGGPSESPPARVGVNVTVGEELVEACPEQAGAVCLAGSDRDEDRGEDRG